MPNVNIVGSSRVGDSWISASGRYPAHALRTQLLGLDAVDELRVPATSKTLVYEPGRPLYPLEPATGTVTGDLERITGADDGNQVILCNHDPQLVVTVKNDDEPDPDVPGTFIVHGDFALREGNALALEYRAALALWFEIGRLEEFPAYEDVDEVLYARAGHGHADGDDIVLIGPGVVLAV